MSDPPSNPPLLESLTTEEAPTTSTTFGPYPVNLPLAIALPICLFVFLSFSVILVVCLARRKKCSEKPVEPSTSRGSVEGSSDNGDNNNNNDGKTDNHQAHGFSADEEILEEGGKPDAFDVSPEVQGNSCAGTPEKTICLPENQDETECTTRTIIDGEEDPMTVYCEHKTSADATETVAVAAPFDRHSQMQDSAIEIPVEDQGNFQTYIAVYSFEAEHENQMSLAQSDVVLVAETEEHEGWLCGWKKNSSDAGWFPKSHVREVEQHSFGTIETKLSGSKGLSDDFDEDIVEYECRALYAFDGAEEGELSLKAGDTLVVHHGVAETGWLYGQRGDEFGWFPSTYVEVISGSDPLKSASFDTDYTTTTTHDLEEAQNTDEKGREAIAPTDIVAEDSNISPCLNPAQIAVLKNVQQEVATSPRVKFKRPSIPSIKPSISDRLGLSKITNFRRRKSSADEPVTLKEVVLVPSPVSNGKDLYDARAATQQKQRESPGKKGKKALQRPAVPPPNAPIRRSLMKPRDEKIKIELCNDNQASRDTNTGKDTAEEYDSSKLLRVVFEPTEGTKRTKALVSEETDCVEVVVRNSIQSKADDTRRQWDIALESFDRILEGSNDPDENVIQLKPKNLDLSPFTGVSGSIEKTPGQRDCSTPEVTHQDTVNGAVPVRPTLQHKPPQLNHRKTSEERSLDLIDGDNVSQKSELGLLSFAPPGFNDSEEVLSPKFLSYLSHVGTIDKSRLCQTYNTAAPLRHQTSLHPPLPPKPAWPPPSGMEDEDHSKEDVSKEDDNDGTLTFIIQKGRSNRQSLLSTLLLPDVVRGYITTDEYEHLQIPPPAGFSSDSENTNGVVSLETSDSPNNFREMRTPRYFGRTMYGPQEEEDDSKYDGSSALPDTRHKVPERVEVPPVDIPTDSVLWRPWGHLEPKITRNSYTEDIEARLDSLRSRHDAISHGVMFKLADGSVVFNESDVGLESVI